MPFILLRVFLQILDKWQSKFNLSPILPNLLTRLFGCLYLILYFAMSQNGQAHFKNLAAFAARFLKCVEPFYDIVK